MENKTKICITGGHLTPALAVIDEIQKVYPDWEIIWIGRTQEYEEIKKRNLQFLAITAGKLPRDLSWSTCIALAKVPLGFIQSFWYILREQPQCVVTFGGYIGLPVAFAGWLLGVPVVTHEQTHTLGIANRLMLPLVSFCLLSYKDTKYSPAKKSRFTGLPIRQEITRPAKILSFSIPARLPIIYITGGSTGAVSMNELLFPIVHSLVEYALVIHQTGLHSIEKAKKVKQALPEKFQSRYVPISYIEGVDIGWIMHHMSLIIGRSGGNTVAETAIVNKPAVFIPLPWSGQQEQEQNARWYEKIGTAYVVDQQVDTSEEVKDKILLLLQQKPKKIIQKQMKDSAATTIIKYIALLVKDNEK